MTEEKIDFEKLGTQRYTLQKEINSTVSDKPSFEIYKKSDEEKAALKKAKAEFKRSKNK